MEAVVEFQAFQGNNNEFIVKELEIVSGDTLRVIFLFISPYEIDLLTDKMRRTVYRLTRNLHKIRWEEGTMPFYGRQRRKLCKPFAIIYTKGSEKTKFLKRF